MHSDGVGVGRKGVEELEQSRGRNQVLLLLAAVPSMVLAHQSPAHKELQSSRAPASLLRDPLGLIVVPILALLVTLGEVPSLCESVLICKIDIRCRLCGFFIEISKGKTCI